MPINVLAQAKDNKNICFDGRVKISLKQNISIGYLKLKVQYADLKTDDYSFGGKTKVFPSKVKEQDVRYLIIKLE